MGLVELYLTMGDNGRDGSRHEIDRTKLTEEAKLLVFVISVRKEADAPEITEKKDTSSQLRISCRPENRTGV